MTEKAFFEWSDAISVGITEIDDQHKVLIGILNRLFVAVAQRTSNDIIIEILDSLIDYTKTHFELEEKLLEEAGYEPLKLASHKEQHRAFIDKVSAVASKHLVDGKSISFELVHFLKRWLSDHILVTDKAYATVLTATGISAASLTALAEGAKVATAAAAPAARKWWKIW